MKQRLTAVLLSLCLCLPLLSPAAGAASSFRDVPPDHWAYPDIMAMTDRGLLQGGGGSFRPGEQISKQAFLSMICRAQGLDDRKLESGADWADPAIAYARYFGWFEDGELADRTAPITRELAAQLLVNAFFPTALSQSGGPTFQDRGEVTPKRLPYVQAAARLGLVNGYADGTFRPKEGLTRAAAASLLYRSLLQNARTPGKSLQVPILMYHDISYLGRGYSKTPEVFKSQLLELKNAGFHTVFFSQLIDYVDQGTPLPEKPIVITIDSKTPEVFKSQLLELKNAGFHTVFFSQLIDYVDQGTPLPEKPIVITIDDGYATNHTYVLPILRNAGFHTVFFSQLIDYVDQGTPLPEKPIVITIDDGYATNHTYVLPILRDLGMKAEISLIGDAVQYADWGLSWDQVREMQESGLVSFQAHTKSLHSDHSAQGGRLGVTKSLHSDHSAQGGRLGVLRIPGENWNSYVELIARDTQAELDLLERETGVRPQVFTYPRGKWNPMTEAVSAQLGCRVSLTTKDGVAAVRQNDPASLRLMDRIGMDFRNGSVVAVLQKFGYQ